jgi:hypothetical protein
MSFYLSGYTPFALTKFRSTEVQDQFLKFPLRKTLEVIVELVKCVFALLSLIPTLILDLILTTAALLGQTRPVKLDSVEELDEKKPIELNAKATSPKYKAAEPQTNLLPEVTPKDLIDFQKAIKVAFFLLKPNLDKVAYYSELIKHDGVTGSDSTKPASINIFSWAIGCFIIDYLRNLHPMSPKQPYLSAYPGIQELEPLYNAFELEERNAVIYAITAPEAPHTLTEAQKVFTHMVNAQANLMTQDNLSFMKEIYWPSKSDLVLLLAPEPSN